MPASLKGILDIAIDFAKMFCILLSQALKYYYKEYDQYNKKKHQVPVSHPEQRRGSFLWHLLFLYVPRIHAEAENRQHVKLI